MVEFGRVGCAHRFTHVQAEDGGHSPPYDVQRSDDARDAVCACGEGVSPLRSGSVVGREKQGQDALATVGLYVHVPFCRSKCRYCGFYSVPAAGRDTGRLVAALLRELERYDGIGFPNAKDRVWGPVEFCTGYIGGGSPTALPGEQLLELVRRVAERVAGGAEFTVECNPGQVDAELLAALRREGVNRLSFGAQSFRAAELELLGRAHTVEDIGRAVELARRAGFDNLGLDLISAIPGSTLDDWQCSVEAAIDLGVQHISAYSLSFEPGTIFDAWRRSGRLSPVEEELDRAMYLWAIERLGRVGLQQYEISNFARSGFECRHNLGYWANRPYVGIGPGAASSTGMGSQTHCFAFGNPILPVCITGVSPVEAGPRWPCDWDPKRDISRLGTHSWARCPCYGQGGRVTHDPDVERYVAAVESGGEVPGEVHPVSGEDAICETAILSLRTRAGIDLAAFQRKTGCDAIVTFAGPIQRYCDMGLIQVTDGSVRLTEQALPIADSILCDFAALE